MKITDVLQSDKITLSMEVFPPKTTTAVEKVNEAVREIAALKPDFMSVTYGAAGGKNSKYDQSNHFLNYFQLHQREWTAIPDKADTIRRYLTRIFKKCNDPTKGNHTYQRKSSKPRILLFHF